MTISSCSCKNRIHIDKKKVTIVVEARTPFKSVSNWEHLNRRERSINDGYMDYKNKCKNFMMKNGFMKIYPQFEKYIVGTYIKTPLSNDKYMDSIIGFTKEKIMNHIYTVYTPYNNLYLASEDIIPCDFYGSIKSGYHTANYVSGYTYLHNLLFGKEIMSDLEN